MSEDEEYTAQQCYRDHGGYWERLGDGVADWYCWKCKQYRQIVYT